MRIAGRRNEMKLREKIEIFVMAMVITFLLFSLMVHPAVVDLMKI